jgi:anti-sigma factor RsiW
VKARILPLDTDEHHEVQSLLPWFASGTLEVAEADRVEAHLAHCARCEADLAWQRRLRDAPVEIVPVRDVECGWAALRRQLATGPEPGATSAAQKRPQRRPWLPSFALGIPLALVAVLAGVWIGTTRDAEPYATLGSRAAIAPANALIVFRPDATETEIRSALRIADARLVGGPTVTDAYLVRVPDVKAERLARLRAQPAVVRVESLEGDAAR